MWWWTPQFNYQKISDRWERNFKKNFKIITFMERNPSRSLHYIILKTTKRMKIYRWNCRVSALTDLYSYFQKSLNFPWKKEISRYMSLVMRVALTKNVKPDFGRFLADLIRREIIRIKPNLIILTCNFNFYFLGFLNMWM